MKRYCMACDLRDQADFIEQYKAYHAKGQAWPEITESIKKAGIIDMEIYLTGNRLFMIMETEDWFDFQLKADYDAKNMKVQEWEELMGQFQQPLPWADSNEKWVMLDRIYKLEE